METKNSHIHTFLRMQYPESVAALLFNPTRTEVLLIQRRDVPVWVLPGGGIDLGERPEQAALREMFEETGFQVNIERLVGVYTPMNKLAKQTMVYEVKWVGGTPCVNEETRAVKFFPLNQLPPLPPPYAEWIADGCAGGPPVTRMLTSVNYQTLMKYVLTHPVLVLRFLLSRIGLPINT